jgi:hypothetical protein
MHREGKIRHSSLWNGKENLELIVLELFNYRLELVTNLSSRKDFMNEINGYRY